MKRITLITLTFFVAITLISCKGKSEKAVAQNTQQETTGMAAAFMKSAEKSQAEEKAAEAEMPEQKEPLYEAAARHGFKMGAVISYQTVQKSAYTDMIKADFNSITASNEFKAYSLLNQQLSMKSENGMPVMNYSQADKIAQFAQENGIGIRGHVLVWDAYMPVWFFKEGYSKDGAFVDSDTMKKRLEYYIDEVVSHFEINFPGVVYCWDVVNEAVADGLNECKADDERRVRTLRGGTPNYFYDVIGPDYVELAFKYARKAANKVNPDIKLFYNDYNTFLSPKREAIGKLITSINKKEKLCDGLGMQGYVGGYGQQAGCMNSNDINLFKNAINFYGNLGVEVHVTELALRNYEKDPATAARHENFYENFFKMLGAANNENTYLTSVSIWGLTDNPSLPKTDYSYKMNGPYCGIFHYNLKKKPEFFRILKALE
ncbi:endo-1,4-beta-xylanase [Treponema bryantii]|uniref:Beta-xylanase n=1 Tax=Treponema bryantii TaxID=163 RepID=A0A1H9JJ03_9SPIR|nr:endo-1,4-beta-xylanase [Treponema bryantii]SEQ86894.1 endo-1,4-beta-xylanase [Treponema bryantii]